jgi:uncharacterized protein (DUF2126 family)
MAIRVALNHLTHYQYDRPVHLSPHVVRLRPAPHCRTPIEAYSLTIRPENHFINWHQDPFGNYQARLIFLEKARELYVEVDLVADMTVINPFDFFVAESADQYPFAYSPDEKKELAPYLEIRESGPRLREWVAAADRTPRRTIDFLVDLNRRLWGDIGYNIRMEPGVQTCERTLEIARGSCRDSAFLLVQILRHLGLASRFVSGYLVQLAPDVKSLDGPSGPEADFTDLHAWTEVYLPGAGWVGLDPTSGLFVGEGHIPLACTPEPGSAAPVTGYTDKCETEFQFHNKVKRIYEDPRVTKPYTERQWAAVNALGEAVEADLNAGDVRLTMGGEPTFVSVDDMESAQWNTAADGVHKRTLAGDLVKRLHAAFAPGGMRHYGQGKWYPGEELPRWRLSCFWRTDGVAMWRDTSLLADDAKDYGATRDHADRFMKALVRRLGLPAERIVPGYEDPLYLLWAEGSVPDNLDPLKANLKDSLERKRVARLLAGDPARPAGYTLPIEWDFGADAWTSSRWTFRRGHMFLIPGDSPMGLRLPLDSLPWTAEERLPLPERSQMAPFPPMDDYHAAVAERAAGAGSAPREPAEPKRQPEPEPGPESEPRTVKVTHTALCAEARNGRLYIFMPPLGYLEHYLELAAAVELAAGEIGMPVMLEGYEPPSDPRLRQLLVTPDPGVIEVNIHPAASWSDLVDTITTLYEEAHFSRLATEKFMLDGRHTGTGGGNHVTIGGATPADSPMLRRPDLLRSLVTYWQHHPGLSYLFAGPFIGPTSQAPRVDEGRIEQLYELEIAFQQMPDGETPFPWMADRLLRNLLVDITGNTHRAEFCIDKLFSPDSLSGQQGIVEFRAFDMPPHARMSVVQMLLIRTLIAWFWREPYKKPLVRWGTELHDRFMLPHYVREDIRDVVDDLNRAGYPFELDWFAPFHEFRFPHFGTVNIRDIQLDLRMALEPWHVLGEEVTRAGTARFVDSSVERIEVKVRGLTDRRHVILCNGRRVLLNNTGVHGEYVGGVRYRAWQPPSALHPTIGIHSPLVFDVFDTWNGRAIGGCTYHVVHPGGRGYDTLPVNAYEAESRRVNRFWPFNHMPPPATPPPAGPSGGRFVPEGSGLGPMAEPASERNPEFPYTLDLRRDPDGPA